MIPESVVNGSVIEELVSYLKQAPQGGCIVEVGVYKGGTLWHLKDNSDGRPVYGYDTFTGIPFAGEQDSHRVGDFSDTSLDAVRDHVPGVYLIPGEFSLSELPEERIAFAHVDCDQYDSIRSCIRRLSSLMLPGGIMWFDDYNSLPGATQAVNEELGSRVEISRFGKGYVRF